MEEIEIDHSIFYITKPCYSARDNMFHVDIHDSQRKYVGHAIFDVFNGCHWKATESKTSGEKFKKICNHLQCTVPDPFREYGVSTK